MAFVLAIGFSSGNNCWTHLQERSLRTVTSPTVWRTLVTAAFLPCSYVSLHISELPASGRSANNADQSLRWCAERLGKLVSHPIFLSWRGKLFLAGKFPLGAEQCQLGGWDDSSKSRLFFPFCTVIIKYFIPLCCRSFLSGLQSSPRAVFIHL